MKKQSTDKLKIIFMGLNNRYESQTDFFEGIRFTFKSGTKSFEGSFFAQNDDKLTMNFLGESKFFSIEEFLNFILSISKSYDSLRMTYLERGSQLLIEADDKKVLTKNQEQQASFSAGLTEKKGRNSFIKPSKAQKLLKEIGIMSEDGKIKNDMIRKYNQIDYFVEVISPILGKLSDRDNITILDSACGKSYLTFVLNYYIKEELKKNCHFIGVDYKEQVIQSSREMAQRLGYKNMEFIREDLRSYTPDRNIDMVISLHACDIATDYAIALGLRAKADSMIIVPCCHKELKEQIKNSEIQPLIKHGVFKARFNDLLTDSIRALFLEANGYEVSPLEYISPLDTPKNLMIRAIKTTKENKEAIEEYQTLKKMFSIAPTMEKYVY